MITRRHLLAGCAGWAAAPALIHSARAQLAWPNRVVRIIVPLAAGGPTDFVARIVADQLSKAWNQQVVIENRPGAGTNLGTEMVARADPDGYTVLYGTSSLAANRGLYRSLGYDPIADLAPVTHVSSFPLFMFVPNSSPAKSVREFIAYAKTNRGKLALASPGTGSMPHLAGELFTRMAGIEMTHVPYRGAAPALNDLIPGRVDAYFGSGQLLENMRAGQIRGLGATGLQRDPAAPELPSIAEAGVPGYEALSWQGLFVPAKTPREIIEKMNADAIAGLADPVIRAKLARDGYDVIAKGPNELAALLKSEIDKWTILIKQTGITIH
jgi:tripartite-type tricarboxylate transporter receptor subunit TctC